MLSPCVVKALIAPHQLRQADIIPALVPSREHKQRALPECPHHQRHEHHTKAPQRQGEEARIGTGGEPRHREEPRRPHGQDAFPDAPMDRGLIARNQWAGFTHSVPPPTRPMSPISTVPPPSSPARVKNPTLPARM